MASMRAVTVDPGVLTLGQVVYASPATAPPFTLLSPNATGTRMFLTQISGGAPAWNIMAGSDLPGHTHVYGNVNDFPTDRVAGRDTAGTGVLEALTVAGGLEFTGAGGIQRSALTGDVTASAGSGTTTIANNAVTPAKLDDGSALSVLGRSANSAGDRADIATVAGSGYPLCESGAALVFGPVGVAGIADNQITLAKLADIGTERIIGRNTAAPGLPEQITIAQALAWLGNTRGQILRRGSALWEALALGAAGKWLGSDGTDAKWVGGSYSASVRKSGNEAVTTGVREWLTLETETYDNGAMHSGSSSQISAPVAGRYIVVGQIYWAGHATGIRQCEVWHNHTTIAGSTIEAPGNASGFMQQACAIIDLAASDYVELAGYQDSGGDLNAQVTYTYLAMALLPS